MMSVMEPLKLSGLSDQEQRMYAELFGRCDVENTGKVTGVKAFELFVTSGLAQDRLHQITEMSGAKRLGHFGRSQFYIALKLIAAAQTGIPVTSENLNSGTDFPLPAFGRMLSSDGRAPPSDQPGNEHAYIMVGPGMGPQQQSGIPPPPKHHRGPPQCQRIPGYDTQTTQPNTRESPPEARSPHFSPSGSPPMSPSHQTVEAPLPKPTPPGAQFVYAPYEGQPRVEKGWAQFDEDSQGLISAQKEKNQWAHFADIKGDTSSISSEAESVDDVWSITDEQREYYINQFMTMQPDMIGVIPGRMAKEFFEKSKLPVQELSKIWQLSDVDRDGSLSREEFCTAMHLVVLRRNDIELPEHLPPGLMPPSYVPLGSTEEPFASDLPQGSTLKRLTPPSPTPPSPLAQTQWPPTNYAAHSPTSSSISSPGAKPEPVKFESKPVLSDPDSKIVHPVAMRVSPDGQPLPIDVMERGRIYPDGAIGVGFEHVVDGSPGEPVLSPTKSRTPADVVDVPVDHQPGPPLTMPLQSRPRPTPKKAQSIPGPSVEPAHPHPHPHSHPHSHLHQHHPLLRPPPSSHGSSDGADRPTTLPVTGEMAPPPPPRARSGHSRSSSLDNQLIDFSDQAEVQGAGGQLMPPPAVPPRPSPKDVSSGIHPTTGEATDLGASSRTAIEKVSESPTPEEGSLDETDHAERGTLHPLDRQVSRERRDLKAVIRKHRERNGTLARFNNELNQELQEVMEQRIALEIQLEHLRPFST